MSRTGAPHIGAGDERRRRHGIRPAELVAALVVSATLVLVTAPSGASAASAKARPKAPSSVVVLVAGFGSSISA
ncbi:MAG TPA: hypothetical protein VNV87_18730, partial [Acidimicrobiales bacterium]|nr:hypothetical protein [Acidimicrobiales bacterium]